MRWTSITGGVSDFIENAKTEKETWKVSLGLLVVSQGVDALAQNEQRGVDVPRLLQPLALVLGFGASL